MRRACLCIASVLALVAELLAVGPTPAAAGGAPAGYTVTPLIGPDATNVTCVQNATSINDQGYVVGQAGFTGSSTADSPVYAFVWHDGTFTQLPNPNPLPQNTGDGTCDMVHDAANDQALEITSSNHILGFTADPGSVVWSSPTAAAATTVTAPGCTASESALDMNAAGALAGDNQFDAASGSCTITNPNPYTTAATLQTTDASTPQALAPSFPASSCGPSANPPYATGFGEAINANNQVLVAEGPCAGSVPASLWQNGTLSTVPLALAGDPTSGNYRYQLLNDSGVVIGISSSNPYQPVYSVDAGTAIPLELPGAVTGATPIGINDKGDVIGEATRGGSGLILWPGDGSGQPNLAAAPVMVNSLLPSSAKLGYILPTAINDGGQILAEARDTTSTPEFVVLTPTALVVNSTALTPDDSTSLANGVCNTTASTSSGTCTLVAAIQLTNSLGGGTITFNIPNDGSNTFDGDVPQIKASTAVPALTAPVTIDGSTQPDVKRIELSGTATNSNLRRDGPFTDGLRVGTAGAGSTIRGMVVNGFNIQLFLQGGGDTIQGDWLGTNTAGTAADDSPLGTNNYLAGAAQTAIQLDSSDNQIGGRASGAGNVMATDWDLASGVNSQLRSTAVINDESGDAGNVIQGNTIGLVPGTQTRLIEPFPKGLGSLAAPEGGLDLHGAETVGGPGAGAGNAVATGGAVAGSTVVQGNTMYGELTAEGSAQIGGGTDEPGTVRGNEFAGPIDTYDLASDLLVRSGKVAVQGNTIDDAVRDGIEVTADHVTIGGSDPNAGNLIHGNASDPGTSRNAGILINGDGNRIEHNTVTRNGMAGLNDAAVLVESGQGNTITANSMTGNSEGIILGSDGYFDDGAVRDGSGPNHHEYYPNLLESHADASGTQVHVLIDQSGTVTVDLYSEPSYFACQPFQGKDFLGSRTVHNVLTGEDVTLTFKPLPAGEDGLTATATSSDGSTSEYSSCLQKNGKAESLLELGVVPASTTIPIVATAATASARPTGARAIARTATSKGHGDVVLLCPPRTVRRCIGTFRLTTIGSHPVTIAHGRYRLEAGLAKRFPIKVSAGLFTKLKRAHRLRVHLRTVAHDGAKHPHHKTRNLRLTLKASR